MTLHRLPPPRLTIVKDDTPVSDPTYDLWAVSAEYAEQLQAEPPSTFDKVSDALGSRDCLLIYFGFIAGTFFTLGMAIVWSVL